MESEFNVLTGNIFRKTKNENVVWNYMHTMKVKEGRFS